VDEPLIVADRYEIIRPLGTGGFAHTLLARDRLADRHVALKVLRPHAGAGWKGYQLFEREAAVLHELRHPGVPAVFETFRAPWEGIDAAFMAMEYIGGTSLEQMIAERRHLEPAAVTELFFELLGVLDYLHTRLPPVLHRDIKPANVLVRRDSTPALVDFGAVRNVFRAPDESTSTVVGTYGYMPYEQYMGQASPASDLYALAATFLHLITGRPPSDFMSDDARLDVPAVLPCDDNLRAILARLLAAAPADRFASAKATRAALMTRTASALVPVHSATLPAVASGATALALGPAPRALTGTHAEMLDRLSYSMWEMMDPDEKRGARWNVADVLLVSFLSVVTIGILPAVFWSLSVRRRRRYKMFIERGQLATARVLDITPKDVGFGVKHAKVRYEFEVEGRTYRDTDLVLPIIADRWDRGSNVQVLYMPEHDYESVIISYS
jgi:serine/threonine protein kinase